MGAIARPAGACSRGDRVVVVSSAGREDTEGWPATIVDLVERRYGNRLGKLPAPDAARTQLVQKLLRAAGELSVADVAGALGWRKREALTALESLGQPVHEQGGVSLWTS